MAGSAEKMATGTARSLKIYELTKEYIFTTSENQLKILSKTELLPY
jgi:hypothetical protein